jgi:hypothetical protein
LRCAQSGLSRDNHKIPSENCCIAKKTGTHAKNLCATFLERAIAVTPVAAKTIEAPKLADGEKHTVIAID